MLLERDGFFAQDLDQARHLPALLVDDRGEVRALVAKRPAGRNDAFRKQEAAYARAWYASITRDAWG